MAEKIDITPESSLLSHHTMHLFKYDDLDPDQFRLLKLHPQTPTEDGLLTCDLETWHRRDCPSYMALSYAWESHSGTRPIVIRGIRHLVSETVEQALQHLRRDVVQHIWVDQLCINQLNDQEKSSQVQQMRDTYQTANKVVAWLGLEFANSRLLFDHFPALEAAVQKQEWEGLAKLCANPDEVAKVKEAYAAFCDLPYWKRLWVIQEFAVAQQVTIACGSSSVDSDMVYNILTGDLRQTQEDGDMAKFYPTAWDITRRDNCTGRSFVENVIIRRSTFRSGNEDVAENQNPFITVLSVSLVLECDYNYPHTSDPRDRVFSLLNLATDTRHFSTFPDYSKTCEEVYTEAAMYFLNQGYIDALVFCQFPRKLETLPSWVPDWSMEVRWPCGQPPWTSKFSASGDTLSKQAVSQPEPGLLQLQGFFVDRIKEFGQVWDPDWLRPLDSKSALVFVNDILRLCKKSPRVETRAEWVEAVRIASADGSYFPWDVHNPFLVDLQCYDDAGKALQSAAESSSDKQDEGEAWSQHQDWFRLALHRLHSRRPFLGASGFLGLCPDHVQAGDEIYVFLGAKVPMVLRPRGDGSYSVVGEAYVHGIMYGEMMKGDPHVEAIFLR